jgi:hypothetical protein
MQEDDQLMQEIRRRIEHEDNLLNQRVSWIVSSQAFLLTGYAILLNGPAELRSERFARDHALLMKLIPFTSIAVTILLWLGILAGICAMRDLRAAAKMHHSFEASHIQGRPVTRLVGLTTLALVPAVFLITWLLLILH